MEGSTQNFESNSFKTQCEIIIGVLAVQGSFYEHIDALKQLSDNVTSMHSKINESNNKNIKLKVVDIRSPKDVSSKMRGLIIPGGESTTLNIFLKDNGFFESIQQWIRIEGNVVWGTCAGMILLSNSVVAQTDVGQLKLGGVDVTTSRNYFGRQRQSFESNIQIHDKDLITALKVKRTEHDEKFHGIFIRAPGIVSIDNKEDVKVLATLPRGREENDIVAVRQGNIMITSFHPELTDDLRFHKYFINMIIDEM